MRAALTRTGRRPPAVRELLLIAALYTIYRLGRLVAADRVTTAVDNAHGLWGLERALHLPSEASFQQLLLQHDTLVQAANLFYATVHFPATIAFLLWTYWRHPAHYLWIRRVLTALTGAGLLLHLLVPLAPPRLVASFAMIDTGTLHSQSPYGDPATDSLANQYAAMPSLHVGWALVIAFGMIAVIRGRRRFLWLLHPLATFLVVVVTANHYWLDGVIAAAILAATVAFLRPPTLTADATGPSAASAGVPGRRGREHEPQPTAS